MLEFLSNKNVNHEVPLVFEHIENVLSEEFSINKIDADIFLLGVLTLQKNTCRADLRVLKDLNLTLLELEVREHCKNKYITTGFRRPQKKSVSQNLKNIIDEAYELVKTYRDVTIENEPMLCLHHIILATVKHIDEQATKLLNKFNLNFDLLERLFVKREDIIDTLGNLAEEETDGEEPNLKIVFKPKELKSASNYCSNISEYVSTHQDEVKIFGRDKELKAVFDTLSRKNKNNVVLCGETGVGRTSIVYKLAQAINEGCVPRQLLNKQILSLNISSVVAGTTYRGDFEKRMLTIIDELKNNKEVILFINELHTIVGAGNQSNGLDAAQILKPALSNGDIQIIGTTNLNDYKKTIESDTTLTRKFQKIYIEEPTIEEAIEIIKHSKEQYETFHNVIYTDEIIELATKLSKKYITERCLPDSVIDVLDTVGASIGKILKPTSKPNKAIQKLQIEIAENKAKKNEMVKNQEFDDMSIIEKLNETIETLENKIKKEKEKAINVDSKNKKIITETDLNATISKLSGVPITKISGNETKALLELEKNINTKVIGQEDAVKKICNAVIRGRVGFRREGGTIATILGIGQTGVGKCICGDGNITIKNKKNGEILNIPILDFIKTYLNQ